MPVCLGSVYYFTITTHRSQLTTHSIRVEKSSANPTNNWLTFTTHCTVRQNDHSKDQEIVKPRAITNDCIADVCTCCLRLFSQHEAQSRVCQTIKADDRHTTVQDRLAMPVQLTSEAQTQKWAYGLCFSIRSPSPFELSHLRLLVGAPWQPPLAQNFKSLRPSKQLAHPHSIAATFESSHQSPHALLNHERLQQLHWI